jgi:hypothetical protein
MDLGSGEALRDLRRRPVSRFAATLQAEMGHYNMADRSRPSMPFLYLSRRSTSSQWH